MACNHRCRIISNKFKSSLFNLRNSPLFLPNRLKFSLRSSARNPIQYTSSSAVSASSSSFTWDDVLQIAQSQDGSSGLQGFFEKIDICNRGSVTLSLSSLHFQISYISFQQIVCLNIRLKGHLFVGLFGKEYTNEYQTNQ